MSNITVISRSEKTDVSAKLVIENIVEEMKETEPRSSVTSAIFAVPDTIFHSEGGLEEGDHPLKSKRSLQRRG